MTKSRLAEFLTVDLGSAWPEVGRRLLQRVYEGIDMADGWIIVQPDIYVFAVIETDGMTVRSIIREYLLTEVSWRSLNSAVAAVPRRCSNGTLPRVAQFYGERVIRLVEIKLNGSAKPSDPDAFEETVAKFVKQFSPTETTIHIFSDDRTGAIFSECHVSAKALVELGTIDTALDPEGQPEYRANRDLVEDHTAYKQMVLDAHAGRTFSNIVSEYITGDPKPLKIIGGQHRYTAIQTAYDLSSVNKEHGIKVYFDLDSDQRLDVQVISNTNISVSRDLLDRMYETLAGADLREWCQKVGLLGPKEDFTDKRKRGSPISVRAARSFIINYYLGAQSAANEFEKSDTTPVVPKSGTANVAEWDSVKKQHPDLWTDDKLLRAGKEFKRLVDKQRESFARKPGTKTGNPDFAEKAMNDAVLSAWPYVAGLLKDNDIRLQRHFGLTDTGKPDPLRAAALAKGRHQTDPENYRGLGYRTDPKERGRFVELFWLQAEKGGGISDKMISAAIAAYHAKQALLDAEEKKKAME
ncbi:hypothetical protein [Mesorhizobium sp. M0998]|uniref:hypothetical protein n=1 Tax=Mesorhizobium sp. M0998 TaxID=2957044 RepID=UPI00333ABFA1